ncbi:MAG: hypothetical protein ACRDJ4_01490 [Actinomycetota bacterium]
MGYGRIAWGIGALAAYLLAAAMLSTLRPVRPLYDGLAPPPAYRWVTPPRDFAEGNQRPEKGTSVLDLGPDGSKAAGVDTLDGQASVTFPDGAFAPEAGATLVSVAVTPLDPAAFGPHPSGLEFDGNAYRVEAGFLGSQHGIRLAKPVTVILRYAVGATRLLRWSGSEWMEIRARGIPANLQIFGDSPRLGTFVAARPAPSSPVLPLLLYVSASAALAGATLGLVARRRAARLREKERHAAERRRRRQRGGR